MIKILCIVGSLRADSFNLALARAVTPLLSDEFTVKFANLKDLPLYNQELDEDFPAFMRTFKASVAEADALLFVTPEYNRSIPGVLKNALDIGSRPGGEGVWGNKPAGILGTSMGAIGTALAQQHLRQVLAFLNVPTMAQPEAYVRYYEGLFDEAHNILDPGTKAHLEKWVGAYESWVKTILKKA